MAAGRYNITIEQGATYDLSVQYVDSTNTPINLSGYSARMDIRPSITSDTIYLRLSSSLQNDGTGIRFTGESGTLPLNSGSIYVYVSAENTTALDFDLGVYDLELTSGSVVTRLLQGNVKLSKEVTSNRGTAPNQPTGSGVTYATTGSNTFIGDQRIIGGVYVTGSLTVSSSNATFHNPVIGLAGFTGSFSGSFAGSFESASFASTASYWSGSIRNALSASFASTASYWSGSIVNALSASYALSASFWSGSIANALSSSYALTASFALNVTPIATASFLTTGSNTYSGSQVITGSIRGAVLPLSVASSTASLNLSTGNFYTLQLVNGSNIHISASNINPGQTVNILVNTTGSGTVSFNSAIKQPSGSSYTPTATTGVDILTLITFNSESAYVANVKNLI